MLWRRDEAMFYSTVATDLILVSTGMKKTDIQRFPFLYFWQKHFIDMLFRIIIIMTVAGDPT